MYLLTKIVRKNDNSTLRFYTNSASLRDAIYFLSQSVQLEYAVWLPLQVFKQLARSLTLPTQRRTAFTPLLIRLRTRPGSRIC